MLHLEVNLMDFEKFINAIPKIEKETLQAADAHIKMAPLERISSLTENVHDLEDLRKAAVMMLIYPNNSIAHLALIVRNKYEGMHSSQIALPGGKAEAGDAGLKATALRETFEEIGIRPEQIEVVRQFTDIYIPPSKFLVSPFLGISFEPVSFNPSQYEVAGMVELPLDVLLDDSNVIKASMATSYSSDAEVPAFKFGSHIIWGATAMIMSELKEVIKKVLE